MPPRSGSGAGRGAGGEIRRRPGRGSAARSGQILGHSSRGSPARPPVSTIPQSEPALPPRSTRSWDGSSPTRSPAITRASPTASATAILHRWRRDTTANTPVPPCPAGPAHPAGRAGSLPAPHPDCERSARHCLALLTRMLFSAPVDADRLDTESFCARRDARTVPRGNWQPLARIKAQLDRFMADEAAKAAPTSVNAERAKVLATARAKAELEPGLFSLTVPTGGRQDARIPHLRARSCGEVRPRARDLRHPLHQHHRARLNPAGRPLPAPHDQGTFGGSRKPRAGRERMSRIPAGGLHARSTGRSAWQAHRKRSCSATPARGDCPYSRPDGDRPGHPERGKRDAAPIVRDYITDVQREYVVQDEKDGLSKSPRADACPPAWQGEKSGPRLKPRATTRDASARSR